MFIEKRKQGPTVKYYLSHTVRTGTFKKIRTFLGVNLSEEEIKKCLPQAEERLQQKMRRFQFGATESAPKKSGDRESEKPVSKKLRSFSIQTVQKTALMYNKAFHAKVFTLFASSESEVYTFSKRFSPHYDFCFAFMKNDEGQWFLDIKGIDRVRRWIIRTLRISPQKIFQLYTLWQKDWDVYLDLSRKLLSQKLTNLSNKKLYDLFEQFYTQYLLVGSIAYICDSFMSTGESDWLEELLKKELEQTGVKKEEIQKTTRILTSPVHRSFTLEAEYQLLALAEKISTKFHHLPSLQRLKNDAPHLHQRLMEFENRFYWIQNNYHNVTYLDADYFYEQIEKIITEAKNSNKSISYLRKEKEAELNDIKIQRDRCINSLGLSSFAKHLLETAVLFAKWKDVRKSGVYIGMHHFDRFLDEIARRTGSTKRQLTFCVFPELKNILQNKSDMTKELAEREKKCFFAVTPKGYFIAGGNKAEAYFKIFESQKTEQVVELRGVVASVGYARGRVRIIQKTGEMKDFKEGEILVTNQTTPEFVPIMKKAAAIITEQGGITSHAAIVSREMKKPCIIGTKIATKALLNGEIVEVDARNGIIRRER